MERCCVFWNLQRFFDPIGLPVARSLDAAGDNWSLDDYSLKLSNIVTCLIEMTQGHHPLVIAFAEVESLRILKDIRRATGWEHLVIVDEVAPDLTLEGLDVVMMFDERVFDSSTIQVQSLALDNRFATRDLLGVRLTHKVTAQQVVVYVAHWPSRLISEGEILRFSYSLYTRRLLTQTLKFSKADLIDADGTIKMPAPEILMSRWSVPCFILGDFNDEPFDKSVRLALTSVRSLEMVKSRNILVGYAVERIKNYLDKDFIIYNPGWSTQFSDNKKTGGTFYYSEWRTYDQVLLTHGAIADDACVRFIDNSLQVFRSRDSLGSTEKPVNMCTKAGFPKKFSRNTQDGVSDHFPLVFRVEVTGDEQ